MICLQNLNQTGSPQRINCSASPSVCQVKMYDFLWVPFSRTYLANFPVFSSHHFFSRWAPSKKAVKTIFKICDSMKEFTDFEADPPTTTPSRRWFVFGCALLCGHFSPGHSFFTVMLNHTSLQPDSIFFLFLKFWVLARCNKTQWVDKKGLKWKRNLMSWVCWNSVTV